METQKPTQAEAEVLARKHGLTLLPETRIRFRPVVTCWAGDLLEGRIVARNVPNPYGFFPQGTGYYDVEVWCPAGNGGVRTVHFVVRPQDIEIPEC